MSDHGPEEDRPGLHENAQEALQFLALGAGIVLVIRLAVMAIDHWGHTGQNELEQAMAPFRNGYPLIPRDTMVIGGLAIIPRIAVGLLFALLCGVLCAGFAWVLGRVVGTNGVRSAVIGSRAGLLLGGAWAIYCLLCLPPQRTQITANGLVQTQRPAFLRTIPFPFVAHTISWEMDQVDGYEVRAQNGKDGRTTYVVVARSGDRSAPIAAHVDEDGSEYPLAGRQQGEAVRLVTVLGKLAGTQ